MFCVISSQTPYHWKWDGWKLVFVYPEYDLVFSPKFNHLFLLSSYLHKIFIKIHENRQTNIICTHNIISLREVIIFYIFRPDLVNPLFPSEFNSFNHQKGAVGSRYDIVRAFSVTFYLFSEIVFMVQWQ